MKIAVNTRLLVPEKMDGIARFSFETLQIITRTNPEIEFTFIFDRKVEDEAFDFPKNVKFVSVSPPARHPILWFIWFEISLKNYLNKNNFDLFLSPEGWVPPKLKCRSLAVMHDLNFEHYPENIIWSHRKYLLHFFPQFAKRATRIATVSEYSKKDIEKCYSVPSSRIDVVYNGANDIFKPVSEESQSKFRTTHTNGKGFFIFIGTIHPRKNLETLFLAFDQFKTESSSDMKLLVAGNKKWWPNQLENTFQSLNHKQDIIFAGRLTDTELATALSSATALTYTPYFEGFGIPILEAFQAETAVITSNVTSMPEIANGAAFLCNPRQVEELSKAMKIIVTDTVQRESLIEKGNIRKNDFSWQKTADLLWKSIQKTLAN